MKGFSLLSTVGHEILGKNRSVAEKDHALFFTDGWGPDEVLNSLSQPGRLARPATPIDATWTERSTKLAGRSFDISFPSPMHDWLPDESKIAHARAYFPRESSELTPVCVIFAMTGDEGYRERIHTFSAPLLKNGIATILLENPFYGGRKPKHQKNCFLSRVSDMLTMSVASVEEGKSILFELRRRNTRYMAVAGVSQGGMIAAVVGAVTPHPLAIAANLAAHSPEVIFTEGLLRAFVDWDALEVTSPGEAAPRMKVLFQGGDLMHLPKPVQIEAAVIQGAVRDLVVPRSSIENHIQAWAGAKVLWLPGTHVTSLKLHGRDFRQTITMSISSLVHSEKTR